MTMPLALYCMLDCVQLTSPLLWGPGTTQAMRYTALPLPRTMPGELLRQERWLAMHWRDAAGVVGIDVRCDERGRVVVTVPEGLRWRSLPYTTRAAGQ